MVDPTSDSGSVGAGQQYPSDSNSDFDVTCFIVRQMMSQLETMKLVKVTAVTGGGGAIAKAGTVSVQLLVNQLDGAGNSTPHGIVHGIPWWRLQGGTGAVICDPVVGDIGYVLCADRDISNVKTAVEAGKSAQTNPGSFRKYSVSDGIYVGGCLNDIPAQYLAFTADGMLWTDKSGNVLKSTSAGFEMTPAGGIFKINGNAIVTGNLQLGGGVLNQAGSRYTGTISTAGDLIAGTISVKSHTHTQPADSHGDTEQPTNPPTV